MKDTLRDKEQAQTLQADELRSSSDEEATAKEPKEPVSTSVAADVSAEKA